MRECPYCAESIQDEAIVCRHCGLDLDLPDWLREKARCPYCAEFIGLDSQQCPYCKSELGPDLSSRAVARLAPRRRAEAAPVTTTEKSEEAKAQPYEPPQPEQTYDREFADESLTLRTPPPEAVDSAFEADKDKAEKAEPQLRWQAAGERLLELLARATSPAMGPVLLSGAVILVIIILLAMGLRTDQTPAAAPTGTQPPTATPTERPTSAPTPESTVTLQAAVETNVPPTESECLRWDQVTIEDVGKNLCVFGELKRWYSTSELPFVAVFSEEPGAFFMVDRLERHEDIPPGTCIQAFGAIEEFSGVRPYMNAAGNIMPCP